MQSSSYQSDSTSKLSLSFAVLLLLVAGTPVLAMSYGGLGPQFLTLVVAIVLALLPAAPTRDVARAFTAFRTLSLAACFPIALMLCQIIPLPPDGFGQPIWQSAGAALARSLAGHVTIDLGWTLRALFGYLTLLCLCFATTVLAQNRKRAETLLFALCAVSAFGAALLVLFRDPSFIKPGGDYTSPLLGCSVFGTILSAALLIRTFERRETQSDQRDTVRLIAALFGAALGIAMGIASLVRTGSLNQGIAAALGLAVLLHVVLVRRLSLQRGTAIVTGFAILVAGAGVVVIRLSSNTDVAPLLRLTNASISSASAAARMISDANGLGWGVGTYQALASIYRDVEGLPSANALNSMSAMLLGWGQLGLLLTLASVVLLFSVLMNGAIRRGRDSFYASAAAAVVVATLAEAFCDASFGDTSVQMLAAIILGLGLAQTVGQTAKS